MGKKNEALEGFYSHRDIGQKLKGIWDSFVNFKGIRDTWINFRDIGKQCFLNFGDICHIYFRDMG